MTKDYSETSNNNDKQDISNLFAGERAPESEWYDDLSLRELLIKHVLDTTVSYAVSSIEEFKAKLIEVKYGDIGNYIIPMNVSSLSKQFTEKENNHWVGIYIVKANDGINVTYIDPMGHTANDQIESMIRQQLSRCSFTDTAVGRGIQIGEFIIHENAVPEFQGNMNDCGPFLIYCMACISRNISIKQITTVSESKALGKLLRDSFDQNKDFKSIQIAIEEKRELESVQLSQSIFDKLESEFIPLEQPYINKTDKLKSLRSKIDQIMNYDLKENKRDSQENNSEQDNILKNILEEIRTYKYNDTDIHKCLIELREYGYYKIFKPIIVNNLESLQNLDEAFKLLLKKSDHGITIVIPINTDSKEEPVWAGLVLKKDKQYIDTNIEDVNRANKEHANKDSKSNGNKKKIIKALYQDPTGESINKDLANYFKIIVSKIYEENTSEKNSQDLKLEEVIPELSIIDYKEKQLDNNSTHDSGALSVLNMHSLALTDILTNPIEQDIIIQHKIVLLKQIEEQEYKPLIQQLAYKNSLEEIQDLTVVLNDLGQLHIYLGDLSNNPKYYTDAAIFYNYIITIFNDNEILKNSPQILEALKKEIEPYIHLNDIQNKLLEIVRVEQNKLVVIKPITDAQATNELSHKEILIELREKIKEKIVEIEDLRDKKLNEEYIKAARDMFEDIAAEMQQYLALLYREAENILGTPPDNCGYTVIGLGSMALKQMTPYSDLEFAIITEKYTPEIGNYFQNLTHLVHFRMIALGETIIPTSKYDVDMSHLVPVAVNFDLGGKTPLGRIDKDKPYSLIGTMEWLMHYVRNKAEKSIHIDKALPYILEKVCYVYGDKDLAVKYDKQVHEFLQQGYIGDEKEYIELKNHQVRALKILEKNLIEINYTICSSSDLGNKLKGDLEKLHPNLEIAEGRLFDVKPEIYRLPDRMVYNLGMYFGTVGESAWDTIDKLEEQNRISTEGAANLRKAVSFATTLRLKAYSYYKAQKDYLSLFAFTEKDLKEQTSKVFHLTEKDFEESGALFQYFYIVLSFHQRIEEFCNHHRQLNFIDIIADFFKKDKFYLDTITVKGLVYYKLFKYKEAQNFLERALTLPENQQDLLTEEIDLTRVYIIKRILQRIYTDFNNKDLAINHLLDCLKISKILNRKDFLGDIFNNLGNIYKSAEEYDKAINCYEQSFKLMQNTEKAGILNNMGIVYEETKQYEKAFEKYLNSLSLLLPNEISLRSAIVHANIASCFDRTKNYKEAMHYHNKVLRITEQFLRGEPHFIIADYFNNLGITYSQLEQYEEAIECFFQSFRILKIIHRNNVPASIAADYLYNLGNIYNNAKKSEQAIECYKNSLKILKAVYQDEPTQTLAYCLSSLATMYIEIQDFNGAIEYFSECLKIQKIIDQNTFGKPSDVTTQCLIQLGTIYFNLENFSEAIKFLTEYIEIKEYPIIPNNSKNEKIIQALNKLGLAYLNEENYSRSLEYLQKSLEIAESITNYDSKDIIKILINIANCYAKGEKIELAINFYNKGIEKAKLIYNNNPCYEIINALKGLGNVHIAQNNLKEAIDFYDQSFNLLQKVDEEGQLEERFEYIRQLGNAYMYVKVFDKAILCFKECLATHKLITSNDQDIKLISILNDLGAACYYTKYYNESINYNIQCLNIKQFIHTGKPHLDISNSYMNLVLSYKALSNYEEAIRCCIKTLNILSNLSPNSISSDYYTEVQDLTMKSILSFVTSSALNPEMIFNLITTYNGFDFKNYKAFYNFIIEEFQPRELIDLLKLKGWSTLALILTPEEDAQMIKLINDDILKLTLVNEISFNLWLAARSNELKMVAQLIEQPNIDVSVLIQGTTPLIQSIINNNVEIVTKIIAYTGDNAINRPDYLGASPLYCALGYYGQNINTEIVNLLINNKANVNQPMNDGDTPMHMACYNARLDVIQLLFNKGANINAVNCQGKTPMNAVIETSGYATSEQKILTIKYLLDNGGVISIGANLNIVTEFLTRVRIFEYSTEELQASKELADLLEQVKVALNNLSANFHMQEANSTTFMNQENENIEQDTDIGTDNQLTTTDVNIVGETDNVG